MKLIVFGATGKTGWHVWRNALDRGHDVTAFARSPQKIEGAAGLRVARGDAMDAASVADAVAGHDAVIVALGSKNLRDRTTLTTGTRNVLDGMTRHAVERLVVLSAAGVGESRGQVPLPARLLFSTLLRNIHADHTAQEALVRASAVDWTIVRAAILHDGPASGNVTATNMGKMGRIARADLAAFLVEEAQDGTYSKQAIAVTS